jgi:hypothetical protein
LAAPLGAEPAQTPMVWPPGMVHAPVQQSAPVAQASPGCTQNEDAWQVPPEQSPEQQVALEEQVLPMVEHCVLSAVHVPPAPHVWLQHWPFEVQESPSDWQAG